MTTHTFSTDTDPSLFLETDDNGTPARLAAGSTVLVRDASDGTPLPATKALDLGYLSFTTTDVPGVQVSGDDGATWKGPFWSKEARASTITGNLMGSRLLDPDTGQLLPPLVPSSAKPSDSTVAPIFEDPANASYAAIQNIIYEGRKRPPASNQPTYIAPTVAQYNPATAANLLSSIDLSWTDVETDNLKVSFVVPPSGKVILELSARAHVNAGLATARWAVRDTLTITESAINVATSTDTEPLATSSFTRKLVVGTDSSGAPLVPGERVTWTWVQMSSKNNIQASIRAGGQNGPACMTVTPISHRLTDAQITATATEDVDHAVSWLCHDRQTLLGRSTAGPRAAWSTNDGATWTDHSFTFGGGVNCVREMDDGEVLVFTGSMRDTANCRIYRSSGWAADHASATFTQVLEGQGVTDPGTSTPMLSWASWGIDSYGPIVVANEYNTKNGIVDGKSQFARYCWLSEDYGATWRIIYDLNTVAHGRAGYHLHGVCYDPWWDAIWLSHGDQGDTRQQLVTFDRGKTWSTLPVIHQMTSVVALPDCVLWFSDNGSPNGIFRTPRTSPSVLLSDLAYEIDNNALITTIGNQAFRSRSIADPPTLIAGAAGHTDDDVAKAYATYDGYTFVELWRDTVQGHNQGLTWLVGPTKTGKYHGAGKRNDGTSMSLVLELR